MRLSKDRVSHMAESLVVRLQERGHLELLGSEAALVERLDKAITDELMVEDRLNAEVRELMRKYQSEIEKGAVDYQKMFTLIKNKLVRERGLIL